MPQNQLEQNIKFNLQVQINAWVEHLKSEPSITESDRVELQSHFLDIIDGLTEVGLDEEEAFLIASRRMGSLVDWDEDYKEVNNSIIQMRKPLIILAGVLIYFLFYFLIKFSSKLIFIVLLLNDIDGYIAVRWVFRYLVGTHFLFVLFAVSIYLLETKTISFVENVKAKPRYAAILLFTAIGFCIADTCLLPVAKNLMRNGVHVEGQFYDIYFYFNYSFPLLICISFVILYVKYFRKTKFS